MSCATQCLPDARPSWARMVMAPHPDGRDVHSAMVGNARFIFTILGDDTPALRKIVIEGFERRRSSWVSRGSYYAHAQILRPREPCAATGETRIRYNLWELPPSGKIPDDMDFTWPELCIDIMYEKNAQKWWEITFDDDTGRDMASPHELDCTFGTAGGAP